MLGLGATFAQGAEFIQDDWQAGAVAGSTTSSLSGWAAYDSQDGNIVVLSTGIQLDKSSPGSWVQTDDGSGDAGFNRAGSVFSSAAVSGTGSSAYLHMVVEETVTVKATQFPEPRGEMGAAYHPPTGRIYLFGGSTWAFHGQSSDVFHYTPDTDSLVELPNKMISSRKGVGVAYHPGQNIMLVNRGSFGPSDGCGSTNVSDRWDQSLEQTTISDGNSITLGHASAVYYPSDGMIYLFGKETGGIFPSCSFYSHNIVMYNAVTDTLALRNAVLPSSRSYTSAAYHPGTDKIYIFGGYDDQVGYLDEIVEYDPVADSTKTMSAVLPSPRRKTSAVYYPPTGRILVFGGIFDTQNLDEIVEYDPVGDTVTVRPVTLPSARSGTAAAYDANSQRVYIFGASSGPVSSWTQIVEYRAIAYGTYVSSVFDAGNLSNLDTISWNPAAQYPASVSLGIGFRAGNTPSPDASWSSSGDFAAVSNGGSIASFGPARYVQYSATFTTVDVATGAVLADLAISYTQTAPSGTLVSSAFDTGFASSLLKKIAWQGTFPSGTTAQFQIRTASDAGNGYPATWSSWLGPTGTGDYYTSPGGSDTINTQHADSSEDRWFQYRALMRSSATLDAPTVTTITVTFAFLPSSPTLTGLTPDSSTQFTLQWTDTAINEDEFIISSGTASGPTNTGAAVPTTDKPGSGGTQSTTIAGLSPNARYFVRLRSHVLPLDDLFSPYSDELDAYTLPAVPTNPQASSVFQSSLTLSWSANNNPGTTPYEVSLSTDDFTTHFSTPVAFSAGLTADTTALIGLDPGTTYYLRVRARNGDGIAGGFSVTVVTPAAPSPPAGLSGSAIGASSITWTWASGGPAARYRVFSASSGVLSADLGSPSYVQTGLSTNTAAGLQVEPYTATASGGLSPPVTAYTLAAPPADLSIDAVGPGVVQLSWGLNTNPFGTPFEISASTDGFVANFSTPVPLSADLTIPATFFLGLDVGTTYYFRAQAGNGDGLPSGFSNMVSTQTLPGTVSGSTGSALGVSSISWTWNVDAGPTVASYDVFRASDNAFLGNVSSPAFTDMAISTNTAYGIRVAARNATGSGQLSSPATTYTQAAAPSGTSFTGVYLTSATVSWSVNGNPTWTEYEIERSTNDASFSLAATISSDSHTVTGLVGPATYYIRVRAKNGDGIATAYDASVSTYIAGTPPLPPGGLSATPVGGAKIKLVWSASPSTQVVRYNLYYDDGSGTVDYAALFSSFTSETTSYVTPALSPGAAYRFGLRAQDDLDQEERNTWVSASAAAVDSLSGVRAAIASPSGGLKIAGDRVALIAEPILGAASDIKRGLFQYKASTEAAWHDVPAATTGHPNPDLDSPFLMHWDVSGLTETEYDLRVVATDLSDVPDGAPPSITVSVDAADFDLRGRLVAGRIQSDRKVYGTVSNVIRSAAGDSDSMVTVALPAGALDSSTATISVLLNPAALPAASNGLRGVGFGAEISLSNGQTTLAGGNAAALSFVYLDADNDGIVDGTVVRANSLKIYAYDTGSGQWRLEAASSADTAARTITGTTPHFSFFALFAPMHADLRSARVYPNPYKPNNDDPDDGAAYSPGDLNSGVIFDNLPDEVTVKIYTVSGQLVREMSSSSSGGRMQWDARNGDGHDVASGGYFTVITSPGQTAVVKKVGIIR